MFEAAPLGPHASRITTVTTFLIVAMSIGAVTLGGWVGRKRSPRAKWPLRLLGVLLPVILVWAWGDAPRSYRVEGTDLVVHRGRSDVRIDTRGLESMQIRDDALADWYRSRGNGGLFGWWGRFHSPALGSFDIYGTTKEGPVLVLRARGRTYVVTPTDPEGLRRAIEAARPDVR